jgi:hypothetical protein
MKPLAFLSGILMLCLHSGLQAQTIYVDAVKGRVDAKGSITDPFSRLENAIALASGFAGDSLPYTIEAMVMPDDPDWQPSKMPVIRQSYRNRYTEIRQSIAE